MNKIKVLLFGMSLTMNILCFSQEKPQIVWKEKIHNLNQVNSKDSLVETIFFFDVKGENPLVIHNISKLRLYSCGLDKTSRQTRRKGICEGDFLS